MLLKPKSLYLQMLLAVVVIVVFTMLVFGYVTAKSASDDMIREIKVKSEQIAKTLSHMCADLLLTNDYASMETLLLRFVALPDVIGVQVIDVNSTVLSHIIQPIGSSPKAIFDTTKVNTPTTLQTTFYNDDDSLFVFEPIVVGEHLGWIKVRHSLNAVKQAQRKVWTNTLIVSFVAITISSLLIAIVLKNPIRRIKLLSDFAKELNERKGEQINVGGTAHEIKQLNNSLNYASKKIYETEKELITQKEHLRVTLYSIGDGVIVTDKTGIVVYMNKIAEQLTGYSNDEAIGSSVIDVLNIINEKTGQPAINPVKKVLETGKKQGLDQHTVLISKEGTKRSIADSASPITDEQGQIHGVVLVFRDITEEKIMQDELIKAKKLESLGILAGGIAHDFNNALTSIVGNISIAMSLLSPEDKVYSRLQKTEKATERAIALARQLLTFSKGGAPVLKIESIQCLIKDTVYFLSRGSDIKYNLDISEDLLPAEVDIGQLSQVIQNIIINAQQAMPTGGEIYVKAENTVITEDNHLPLSSGKYIKITIRDTGVGIPDDYISKVFDPYFTTKSSGSGLGLAIAYSIVKKHNGHITLHSQVNVGTTVEIYIPASDEKMPVIGQSEEKDCNFLTNLKVLVMDDEEDIRDVAKEMLIHFGFDVTTTSNGHEALQQYKGALQSSKAFDLVILDLIIPGDIGGLEVLKRLREIAPHIKAIVSSGYSHDPVMANYKDYGFQSAIIKPYNIKAIKNALNEAFSKH